MQKTVIVSYDEFLEMKERIKELEENRGKIEIEVYSSYHGEREYTRRSYYKIDDVLKRLTEENFDLFEKMRGIENCGGEYIGDKNRIINELNNKIKKLICRNLWQRIINKEVE